MTKGGGWIANLGPAKYLEVLDLQRRLVRLRYENTVPDTLILVEHEPVITLGRRGDRANILANTEELASQGIYIHEVERGGDVTYHGPGQLVGYPIIKLPSRELGVSTLVYLLEETIIRTLADFGAQAVRDSKHRGVWIKGLKIAALGVAVRRWVSFHGFALNVSPDLGHFCYIHPCGLDYQQVTSMADLLGEVPSIRAVADVVARRFVELFPGRWLMLSSDRLLQMVKGNEQEEETWQMLF